MRQYSQQDLLVFHTRPRGSLSRSLARQRPAGEEGADACELLRADGVGPVAHLRREGRRRALIALFALIELIVLILRNSVVRRDGRRRVQRRAERRASATRAAECGAATRGSSLQVQGRIAAGDREQRREETTPLT